MVGPFPTDRDNTDLLDTGDFQVSGWPIPDSLLKEGLYAPIYYRIPTLNMFAQSRLPLRGIMGWLACKREVAKLVRRSFFFYLVSRLLKLLFLGIPILTRELQQYRGKQLWS